MTEQIYKAMTEVMRSVGAVGKDGVNQHQKFNFRGIDGVLNAVGPALREHSVVVTPELISADYEHVTTAGGKPSTACRVVVSYVFYAQDGSKIATTVAAESWDTGDKAMAKAMSVAFRTALIQSLALPTDEPDPDEFTYTREAADKRHERVEAVLEKATTADELRKVWSQADEEQQARIMARAKELENAGAS